MNELINFQCLDPGLVAKLKTTEATFLVTIQTSAPIGEDESVTLLVFGIRAPVGRKVFTGTLTPLGVAVLSNKAWISSICLSRAKLPSVVMT